MKTSGQVNGTAAVIGAGVVGLCTALELVRAGYTVTLFDRDRPAKHTSFGNAAYLAAEYLDPLASPEHIFSALRLAFSNKSAFKVTPDHWLAFVPWALRFVREAMPARVEHNRLAISLLNAHAVAAWKELLDFAGAGDELHQSGFLRLWEKAADIEKAREAQQLARQWGFDPELVKGEALFSLEPALADNIHHALYYPGAYHLGDTYQTCLRLFNYFIQRGGRFEQRRVETITPVPDGVKLSTQGQPFSFDKAVAAAGAWSGQILKNIGLHVPLAAERGYHLTLPREAGTLSHILSSADRNVVLSPLDCGLRIVGFGEYANLKSKPVPRRYRQLRQHLSKLVRDIDVEQPDIQTWMGVRPTLPDSLPVIDLHPRYPQIGMVFGHHHLGVTHAAISAKMLSAQITSGKNTPAWKPFAGLPDAYSITRFGG